MLQKLNINIPIRFKNPWFWVGLVAVMAASIDLNFQEITTWSLAIDAVMDVLKNPFKIGCVVVAALGVFIDPTTDGITDSEIVMNKLKCSGPDKEKGVDSYD